MPEKSIVKLYNKSPMTNILKKAHIDTLLCKPTAVQAVTYVYKIASLTFLSHIARFKQKKVPSFTEETLIFC